MFATGRRGWMFSFRAHSENRVAPRRGVLAAILRTFWMAILKLMQPCGRRCRELSARIPLRAVYARESSIHFFLPFTFE